MQEWEDLLQLKDMANIATDQQQDQLLPIQLLQSTTRTPNVPSRTTTAMTTPLKAHNDPHPRNLPQPQNPTK